MLSPASSTGAGATGAGRASPVVFFRSISATTASRYSSWKAVASKSAPRLSTSDAAIFCSCGRRSTSASRISKSGSRTSSGHSIVCSTIALSRTRSSAIVSRWRSATFTTAIRSVCTSASRSSAYGLAAFGSGSR